MRAVAGGGDFRLRQELERSRDLLFATLKRFRALESENERLKMEVAELERRESGDKAYIDLLKMKLIESHDLRNGPWENCPVCDHKAQFHDKAGACWECIGTQGECAK